MSETFAFEYSKIKKNYHQHILNSLYKSLQYSYNTVYKKENTASKYEGYVPLEICTIRE